MGFYVGFSCGTSDAKGLESEIEERAPKKAVAPTDVAHVILEVATMFPHSLPFLSNGCFKG